MLALEGELDVHAAAEGHKRLIELGLPRGGLLILDLSRVTSMDSMGVRLILHAREHARRCGATYVLVRGAEEAMRALARVGLAQQLVIVAPRDRGRVVAGARPKRYGAAMPVR